MLQPVAVYSRKLSKDIKFLSAIRTLLNTPNWEEAVKQYFDRKKQAGLLKGPLFAAIMLLAQMTGAQTADQLIKEVKQNVQVVSTVSARDVQEVSKAIPMLANPAEMMLLTNPIKALRPSYSLFFKRLVSKIEGAVTDQKLITLLKSYKDLSPQAQSDLIGKAFVQKVQQYAGLYDKEHTFEEGINEYLTEAKGGAPKNVKELGVAVSGELQKNPELLKKLFL
jgi:hypothetical protein